MKKSLKKRFLRYLVRYGERGTDHNIGVTWRNLYIRMVSYEKSYPKYISNNWIKINRNLWRSGENLC